MKKYVVYQIIGDIKYYIRRIYCNRIILSSYKSDAKYMKREDAELLLNSVKLIDTYNKSGIES